MSIILEFTIAAEDFHLGKVLSHSAQMQFELERIVPTGTTTMPFIWVTGETHEAFDVFEENAQTNPAVEELLLLDRLDTSRLYRVEWKEQSTDLIDAIAQAEASVLQARGKDGWVFQVRFIDHDRLSQFHNYVIKKGLQVHIDRTYTLSEAANRGGRFNLTPEQREALVLALQQGYFATPRETELEELAEDLGVTLQAVSNRIRRANEKVLRGALLSPATDFDGTP